MYISRRFLSPKNIRSKSDLVAAAEEVGEDLFHRVWCSIYADEIEKRWRKATGVRPYQGDISRLVGKKEGTIVPPAHDHQQLWGRDRKPLIFTMHMYCSTDMTTLVEWANRNGLLVKASAEYSWHFPGRTMLIEFTTPETKKIIDAYRMGKPHMATPSKGKPKLQLLKGGRV